MVEEENLISFHLDAGTVVHFNGIPFYLQNAAFFLGTAENSKLAAESMAPADPIGAESGRAPR